MSWLRDECLSLLAQQRATLTSALLDLPDLLSLSCLDRLHVPGALLEEQAFLWERLHCCYWMKIHQVHRELYGLICAFQITHAIQKGPGGKEVIYLQQQADLALLLGGECSQGLLQLIINHLQHMASPFTPLRSFSKIRNKLRNRLSIPKVSSKSTSQLVYQERHLPLQTFYEQFFLLNKPVLLRGAVIHWPALHKWASLSYLYSGSPSTSFKTQ
jgi:hypothetical protein